ncbi:UDP-forming cellulose synthase catalytic subunit [Shewanella surugensis]|uniref:Cellulose synthase catalytic subunit [UDP-forming] n=1 Tax=Shewanella surugensis TaxID=212020 RepID=A0ABT0L7W7_9GAMM|nr:UDP-forming cellulose synthase catalytic subunit [Shewanella surugensis]MCL1123639.1 UDP-forming cellulose synthase catalytic subunit [Shewanella surugensis]
MLYNPSIVKHFKQQRRFYEQCWQSPSSLMGRAVLWGWFSFCLFFLKPKVAGIRSWRLLLHYYPHINFSHPSLLDGIRFIIQSLWLLIVKQNSISKKHVNVKAGFKKIYGAVSHCFNVPLHFMMQKKNVIEESVSQINMRLFHQNKIIQQTHTMIIYLGVSLVVVLILICIMVPLTLAAQSIFIVILWMLAMMVRRLPGRFPSLFLIALSLLASTRYIWWRSTSTLNWDEPIGLVLGGILLMAEIYAWIILILGYFQNMWPLNRKPEPLPVDPKDWPVIDIMIPTLNEECHIIKTTIYALLGIDWPKNKLNIYILDDGNREDIKQFSKEVGVHYLARPTHEGAKAGNINYALARSDADFVAVFDCDHIPTRAFFQLTMGIFLNDPKLALLQTAHHFFSPDPFERNLANFGHVPNESSLFYGLTQDGNDLWNSAFFCGSCAILRRKPLEEVGGVAVETVTEDAHTSLKMHRLGYRSAYLKQPISAGLATETLSAHVAQRIRWARGMAQIFRIENPLLAKGLKWQQRLCYLNAMLHFLSGIPRIVFLTAPLFFLLFHVYVIYAPALAIILYVLPHMMHASITNSRMQGEYRHSFWGEIYETVIAWYIARPTTIALFLPNKGFFNVTEKGGLVLKSYYDWTLATPYLVLVGFNIAGVLYGIYRLGWGPSGEIGSVSVNLLWTLYNLFILGGAVAVAEETKQVRENPRVAVNIPVIIRFHSGHVIAAIMKNFSLGGLSIVTSQALPIEAGQKLEVILTGGKQEFIFPLRIIYRQNKLLGLALETLSPQQHIDYVQCTFARADTWVQWQRGSRTDKPLMSLQQVLEVGGKGYQRLWKHSPRVIFYSVKYLLRLIAVIASLRPRPIFINKKVMDYYAPVMNEHN